VGKIHIQDLALRCIIGVFPEERRERQDVLINLSLECAWGDAARTDHIADTVDYKKLNKRIIALVEGSRFNLIEALAERIAETCLEDERVQRVTVRVDKPGALRFTRTVGVEIARERNRA